MPLTIGKNLGHFRIKRTIGAGAMGEVYQAEDLRLGREVALKLLPDSFLDDPDSLSRFQREARLLASVNHPNIGGLYDVNQIGDHCFLILELIPGQTLAERIQAEPIGLEEALDYASQMALAIEAAHDRGIIHRDLKPANIRVTPEGTLKILDFGLAKAMSPLLGDSTKRKVDSIEMTREGVVLGTASYMSPEQAKGKPVDKRTDIWSFGCILFEMLSGKSAFPGDSFSEVVAAILEHEPDWKQLPTGLPQRIGELLQHCLVKNERNRLRDIGDARLTIQKIREETGPVKTFILPSPQRKSRQAPLPWILAAASSILAAWALLQPPKSSSDPGLNTRFNIAHPNPVVDPRNLFDSLVFSPDGLRMAFTANMGTEKKIFLRDLEREDPYPLAHSEGGRDPVFSADGKWVLFNSGGKLRRVSISSGEEEVLGTVVNSQGLCQGRDGRLVLSLGLGRELAWKPSAEEEFTHLTTLQDGERAHLWPQILPGGEWVLFTVWTGGDWNESGFALKNMRTGERRELRENGTYGRIAHLGGQNLFLWSRAGTLWGAPFDLKSMEVTASPESLLEGLQTSPVTGRALYALSPDGTLAHVPGTLDFEVKSSLVWVNESGEESQLLDGLHPFSNPSVSADGKRLSVIRMGARFEVYGLEIGTNRPTPLVTDFDSWNSVIHPKGNWIAYVSDLGGTYGLYRQPFDLTGPPEKLLDGAVYPQSWDTEGRWIAYTFPALRTGTDIWVLSLIGERETFPILQSAGEQTQPAISPNGRWIAYVSDETDRNQIYVKSFPFGGRKTEITQDGGTFPKWSGDGKKIFFRRGNQYLAIAMDPEEGRPFGPPEILFEGFYEEFDVTADGRFVMLKVDEDSRPRKIQVTENWGAMVSDRWKTEGR